MTGPNIWEAIDHSPSISCERLVSFFDPAGGLPSALRLHLKLSHVEIDKF